MLKPVAFPSGPTKSIGGRSPVIAALTVSAQGNFVNVADRAALNFAHKSSPLSLRHNEHRNQDAIFTTYCSMTPGRSISSTSPCSSGRLPTSETREALRRATTFPCRTSLLDRTENKHNIPQKKTALYFPKLSFNVFSRPKL